MSLAADIPYLVETAKSHQGYLSYNGQLLDIYEGNLLEYIKDDLRKQLNKQSYDQIIHRIPPINILRRIVDKLSKIYQQQPMREITKNSDTDMLRWYEAQMKVNRTMNQGNEFFNLFKCCLIQPYASRIDRKPRLRTIPADKFFVVSQDGEEPTKPTHVVLLAGEKTDLSGNKVQIYYGYTDREILVFNSRHEIETGMMAQLGNPEGINRFGKIPFVYVNRSLNCTMPKPDSDTLSMTKLFPVLLSDLSFAIMFQAFSIMYGIDVDDENLSMSPNAFWRFKSDPNGEKTPSVGVIKPQVDITEVLGYIQSTLSFWLQSRNIRPGSVGQLTPDNFSSGVSKLVDEMDTSEDRQKQVEFFRPAEEEELWPLIMHNMHPAWVQSGEIENMGLFSADAQISVNFAEQLPLVRRGELVKDLDAEVKAGFSTRKRAIQRLEPQWTEGEVAAEIAEIDAERTIELPEEEPVPGQEGEPEEEGSDDAA